MQQISGGLPCRLQLSIRLSVTHKMTLALYMAKYATPALRSIFITKSFYFIVDGNYLPASEKRLKPRRGGFCGARRYQDNRQGKPVRPRQVALHLEQPAENGDTVIRLLTNLPA